MFTSEPEPLIRRVLHDSRKSIGRTFYSLTQPHRPRYRGTWAPPAQAGLPAEFPDRPEEPEEPARDADGDATAQPRELPRSRGETPGAEPQGPPVEPAPEETVRAPAGSEDGVYGRVRFPRPDTSALLRGTLQLLPGRLEPLGEPRPSHEIRFVRLPGDEQAVTLGGGSGDPAYHITVDHPSLAPRHVRFRYEGRAWTIQNLTPSGGTWINGDPLACDEEPRPLRDGDHVRMGEVEYGFHLP